jgi:hypothetical protein
MSFIALSIALLACNGGVEDPARDAGGSDGGSTRDDGGPSPGDPDGGRPRLDAGPPPDGGPFVPGEAIAIPGDAPYDTWTWIDVPEARCANDTPTGLGINPHEGATDLAIFLAGGGVCWNHTTCFVDGEITAYSLDGYGAHEFEDTSRYQLGNGIFDRSDAANPFRDFHFVFVPYCTGDLHMGDRATEYEGRTIQHVGHRNMRHYLARLVPTFAGVTRVVLTGVSAGGFGASWNFEQTVNAFRTGRPEREVLLVDDSGPYLAAPYFSREIQQAFAASFGTKATLPCAECDPNVEGGGFENVFGHLAATISGFRGSLVCSLRDFSVSDVLSRPPGNAELRCDPGACAFEGGLRALYETELARAAPGRFEVFFIEGGDHVWLDDRPSEVVTRDTSLAEFLSAQLEDAPGWQSVLP